MEHQSGIQSSSRPNTYKGAKTRLLSIALLVILAGAVALACLAAEHIKRRAREDLGNALLTVLKTTQGGLHLWKKDLEADLSAIARLPRLRKLTEEQLADRDGAGTQERLREVKAILRPWSEVHGYLGFTVFARDSSRHPRPLFGVGTNTTAFYRRFDGVIDQALSGAFSLGPPAAIDSSNLLELSPGRKVGMIAAIPIADDTGRTIAALAFSIDPFGDFTQVTQLGGIGKTGETYAVDRTGHMVTRSRFRDSLEAFGIAATAEDGPSLIEMRDPGGDMIRGYKPVAPRSSMPYTKMAQDIMKGVDGIDLSGYRDYRGVEVVGAWLWDKELEIGFATELDKSEAYEPYRTIDRGLWLIVGIVFFAMLIILILSEARARLGRTNFELEQTSRIRRELLATTSHDLKNPLAALLMTNEILLKTLPQNFDFTDKRRKLLEQSRHSAERMRQLITDLLDKAKIEAGKLAVYPAECEAGSLLSEVIEVIEPLAEEKGIHINRDIPESIPRLWVDRGRILQVFSNLLGNAIKFTDANGGITVKAELVGEWVRFSVRDTGPGIAKADIPHLFERYWQAQNTKRSGTGLGLAITQEFVSAHGGKIWAESELGRGSVFFFTVPTVQAKCARAS